MTKLAAIETVLDAIHDGSVIMVGGFLGVGTPENLVDAICQKGVRDLTIIANDTAFPDKGVGKLVVNKQVAKLIVSHIGTNPETGRQMNGGMTEVELVPQGTLAERVRAGGAGLGGVLTPTGLGTIVEQGKTKLEIDGKEYLVEPALKAQVAIVKAYKADTQGNLVFRYASRNFNPLMATAADYVIAEAEHVVSAGQIDPDVVMLPGLFIDAVVLAEPQNNDKEAD